MSVLESEDGTVGSLRAYPAAAPAGASSAATSSRAAAPKVSGRLCDRERPTVVVIIICLSRASFFCSLMAKRA